MAKKKPSQLDRIEKMLTQVHGQNIALRKFVDAILDESRAHHKDPTISKVRCCDELVEYLMNRIDIFLTTK